MKDNLSSHSVDFVHPPAVSLFYLCSVDILVSDISYRLVCVYRLPYFNAESRIDNLFLGSCLSLLYSNLLRLFVAGDFNLPDID